MATTEEKEKIVRLKDYKLYPRDTTLYMSLTYEIDDGHRVKEIHIPNICTCISLNKEPSITHSKDDWGRIFNVELNAGPMHYKLFRAKTEDFDDVYMTEKILYEKPTEMTLEEIEKKLGYKVKIVSEKEKEN